MTAARESGSPPLSGPGSPTRPATPPGSRSARESTSGQRGSCVPPTPPTRGGLLSGRSGPPACAQRPVRLPSAPSQPARRPLADIVSARLAAAGVTADQDEARFISQWNAQRLAAMGDAQKEPGA